VCFNIYSNCTEDQHIRLCVVAYNCLDTEYIIILTIIVLRNKTYSSVLFVYLDCYTVYCAIDSNCTVDELLQ
jgi:hypothetical protein